MKISKMLRSVLIVVFAFTASQSLAGVDELPAEIQKNLYSADQMDPNQPLGDSAYRDWVAKNPPPWTIGYASS